MAPKGSRNGKEKATARATLPTSVIHWHLSLDRDDIMWFILEHIREPIQIYNDCGVKVIRAWHLFYDIFFVYPLTTRHFSQFQLMWLHRRSRSSPFWVRWADFRSNMGQMFEKTLDQMNNWMWDIPLAFGDQVDHSNPQKTSSGKGKRTGERFSCYCSEVLRATIELPSCRLLKPGDFLAVGPLNRDELIEEDNDNENWADPGAPRGRRSCPGNDNDNDDSAGENDTQGGEKGTGEGNGTKDWEGKGQATEEGKGKGKRKGKGNGNGKGIVKQTSEGDDISRAGALQLKRKCQRRTWTPRAN